MELGKGLKHKFDEEQLMELVGGEGAPVGLNLKKRRLRKNLITLWRCLKGGCNQKRSLLPDNK